MNTIDLEKFEQDLYLEEKEEFLSNKCSDCMSYLNEETEECDNNFCIGKIPEEYRQQQPTPPPPTEINRGFWWYKTLTKTTNNARFTPTEILRC